MKRDNQAVALTRLSAVPASGPTMRNASVVAYNPPNLDHRRPAAWANSLVAKDREPKPLSSVNGGVPIPLERLSQVNWAWS
jgi:hypothetical protein